MMGWEHIIDICWYRAAQPPWVKFCRSSATDHDSSTLRRRQLRHEMRCRKLYPRKLPKVDRKEWAMTAICREMII
jgi:hypothetical protein